MSRYVKDVPTSKSPDEVVRSVEEYLMSEGFEKVLYNNEEVWQKGKGFSLGPQFMKVVPGPGNVHIEAWIRMAIFPGVFVGEMGTEGFFGGLPKKKLRARVVKVEASLN